MFYPYYPYLTFGLIALASGIALLIPALVIAYAVRPKPGRAG
jgi:hypothetical protein